MFLCIQFECVKQNPVSFISYYTVVTPNFVLQKFGFGRGNCAFSQNFLTRKLRELGIFCTVYMRALVGFYKILHALTGSFLWNWHSIQQEWHVFKKDASTNWKNKKTRAFHVQHYFRLCLFSSYLHLKIFVSKGGGSVYLETFLVQCLIIKTHTLMYIQEGFLKWGQTFVGTYYLEDINKKLEKLLPPLNSKQSTVKSILELVSKIDATNFMSFISRKMLTKICKSVKHS